MVRCPTFVTPPSTRIFEIDNFCIAFVFRDRRFTFDSLYLQAAVPVPISEIATMTKNLDLCELVKHCPPGDGWGPTITTETTLNGVPYAPFSKGDKLYRVADFTQDGKDREGRGGRSQYNRQYRGMKAAPRLVARIDCRR
jgi:hypothetical protein